jgi:F-type H+-transporting ATPase subunit b
VVEVDLFTLGAQIVNFLVLILLLKHFLYMPVIKTMEEREARIAARLKEAEEKRKDAEREAESYQEKKRELQGRREELLAKAGEEVEVLRKELAEKSRIEIDESKARWYEAVEHQKELFLIDLRRRAGEQIYTAVSRVLRDLANEDLERQIVNTFIKRMQNLKDEEKEAIKRLNQKKESVIVIKSGFDIPEIMRKMVGELLRDQIGDISIKFEIAPELVCGIELHASNWQIAWSLNSYLNSLQEDVSRALDRMIAERK